GYEQRMVQAEAHVAELERHYAAMSARSEEALARLASCKAQGDAHVAELERHYAAMSARSEDAHARLAESLRANDELRQSLASCEARLRSPRYKAADKLNLLPRSPSFRRTLLATLRFLRRPVAARE